jgi:hypothetical protein
VLSRSRATKSGADASFSDRGGLSLIVAAFSADFEVVTIPLAHVGSVERGDLADCFGSS